MTGEILSIKVPYRGFRPGRQSTSGRGSSMQKGLRQIILKVQGSYIWPGKVLKALKLFLTKGAIQRVLNRMMTFDQDAVTIQRRDDAGINECSIYQGDE